MALSIPLVLAMTFATMQFFDIGLHKISLGALVLVSRPGLVATVANAEFVNDQVVASGLGGDDTLTTTIAAGTLARVVLDGGANSDTARIDGEDVGEVYSIVPNGAGARLTRNLPTNAAVDANNAERFVLNAAGDVDFVTTQLLPTLPQSLDGGDPAVFPGGEGLAAVQARAVSAVREHDRRLAAENDGHDVLWVACTHGDVVKSVVADALGTHLDAFQRITADPASMSVIRYTPVRPFVVHVNHTGDRLAGALSAPPAQPSGDATVGGSTG